MRTVSLFLYLILSQFTFAQCDSVAPLNQGVLKYATSKMNKKVGRGECWDLAKYALDEVGAKWDGGYVYGRKLKENECIMPGDIIQFEKVKVKYKVGKQTFTEAMPHHTAIIYKTINDDEVTLIHQNTGYTGKKVGTSSLRFSTIISGKYFIYRPEE
jgi:hypothetical protein